MMKLMLAATVAALAIATPALSDNLKPLVAQTERVTQLPEGMQGTWCYVPGTDGIDNEEHGFALHRKTKSYHKGCFVLTGGNSKSYDHWSCDFTLIDQVHSAYVVTSMCIDFFSEKVRYEITDDGLLNTVYLWDNSTGP
jgi:hypothetical protein